MLLDGINDSRPDLEWLATPGEPLPPPVALSLTALLRSVRKVVAPLACSRDAARIGPGGAVSGEAAPAYFCRSVTRPTTRFERRLSSRSCATVGVAKYSPGPGLAERPKAPARTAPPIAPPPLPLIAQQVYDTKRLLTADCAADQDVAQAELVGDQVVLRRVAEAAVLVLLILRLVGDGRAFPAELEAAQHDHASQDPPDRFLWGRHEARAVVVGCRLPGLLQRAQLLDEQPDEHAQVLAATRRVRVLRRPNIACWFHVPLKTTAKPPWPIGSDSSTSSSGRRRLRSVANNDRPPETTATACAIRVECNPRCDEMVST